MNSDLIVGSDVKIDPSCIFDKISKESTTGRFSFGDNCVIHEDCRFYFSDADFSMGDYGTIHNNT
ncbi:hypothetical protein HN415_10165, partial [Candidatus Woesearchaeota archaeon]|nr:hypothetical protein [Candidatus Woesearchaeota archaeon]